MSLESRRLQADAWLQLDRSCAMEELAAQTYCQRAALELAALIRHQRKPTGRTRRDSALLRSCVTRALEALTIPDQVGDGPWQVGTRPLRRSGRGGLKFIPTAHRGETVVMVNTPQEAEELVAFLNFCGMQEFTSG
ncbi:MAG: hypothetical protein H0V43_06465 [Gemmatimonadales bacterium]|nr:hypothetical protein [Gemmatimonadales bacterium]